MSTTDAARRLAMFVAARGDYVGPLIAAYGDENYVTRETYESAQKRFKADIREVLQALEERQHAH
jgi:hypothetical protein